MTTDPTQFDAGPPRRFARHFAAVPDPPEKDDFWFDWGPIFYRGRLDGSARLLCIGSDPGPTERIANRVLVGNAGQRVQGFLAKIGITQSYVCLNAFPYALIPARAGRAPELLAEPNGLAWRNELYRMAASRHVEAIIAFGANAQAAVDLWADKPGVPVTPVPHPSSHDETALLDAWRDAVTHLRGMVLPDRDHDPTLQNYGTTFQETDYAAIPRRDLPFGVPWFLGDDAWARTASPPRQSAVSRPVPDDRHTLIWAAPQS